MKLPKISIVLAGHNRAIYLRRSLECYALQPYKRFEIIVCDDDSTDDVPDLCRNFAPTLGIDLKYFLFRRMGPYTPRNGALLHNWGIRATNCPIIVTTSPEIMIGPDTLGELAELAGNPEDTRFFNAKPYLLSRRLQDQIDTVDWRKLGACVAVRQLPNFYVDGARKGLSHSLMFKNLEKPGGVGTNMFSAMTRKGWKKIGGHPPATVWGEDDLSFLSERTRLKIPTVTLKKLNSIVVHQNHDGPGDVPNPRSLAKARIIPGPWNGILW